MEPIYPVRARRAGIEGIVMMRVKTDTKGIVNQIEVLRSDSTILNQAAIDAVSQWQFKPIYERGVPVSISTIVAVKFKLD